MRTISQTVYQIGEHPNKAACFDWIRNNWHDLSDHSLQDLVESLKALQKEVGGKIDWSISTVPDRGEFIRLTDYDRNALRLLKSGECPLTGCFWDIEVIKCARSGKWQRVLDLLHYETEYQYSDEVLLDTCEANEYEFFESGKICNL